MTSSRHSTPLYSYCFPHYNTLQLLEDSLLLVILELDLFVLQEDEVPHRGLA
jgi:hypothetical protein